MSPALKEALGDEFGTEDEDADIGEEHLEGEDHIEGRPIGEEGHEEEITNDELDEHGMIQVDSHDQLEKMKNFKKISEDCKMFEDEFRDCLDDIPDSAWEEKEIQRCVGRDFTRIINNISK